MANTYLSRTMNKAENTDSDKKFSYSAWIKRSSLSDACIIEGYYSSTFHSQLYFDSNANLTLNCASGTSGAAFQIVTNRKFRDTSAWYHIVVAIDTTQGTASDRAKIYINGVQETSFSGATYPNQNTSHQFNRNGNTAYLGRRTGGGVGLYFGGLMSHIHTTIGYTYDASAFGKTDTTTGEWEAKTSPSVTYGTNGFFILKDGNSVTDQSSNSNNFTVGGGTLTKTEDCPSNVFATFNSLNSWGDTVLTNGNTTAGNTGTSAGHVSSTIHMNSGKWYMEFNVNTHLTGYSAPMFLLAGTGVFQNLQVGWNASGDGSYGIGSNAKKITDGVVSNASFSDLNAGNKVQIAYDADAGKAWFGINGAYLDSGNPTTAANPYFTTTKLQNNDVSLIILGYNGNAMSANFGNGYFGTTAITTNSGNGYSGAEGSSKFNYTVPTGYSALNTKGLNL